ncbi:MAG: FeoB-associated Cys-rich membrane protein [Ruminococcaceae bacterium]|nr:FeoB-associated Cys-rich membrane protein [Oscillospiraceae bacterium]
MENIILIIIPLVIAGLIIRYLYKAKKRGEKCIGCPYCKQCASAKTGGCGGAKAKTSCGSAKCGNGHTDTKNE